MKLRTITWSKPLAQENQARIAQNPTRFTWLSLIGAWLPSLLLICVVAAVSTAFFGADRTSAFLYKLYVPIFGPTTVDRWWLIHMILRKGGHLCGYGLLSAALFRSWLLTLSMHTSSRSGINQMPDVALRRNAHLLAVFGALIVATADEVHQSFIPNRTGSAWDVLIDLSAAIAAQLLILYASNFLNQNSK